jgi:hypothetical protein
MWIVDAHRGDGRASAANGSEQSVKFAASNKKSPISETWLRRFRSRIMRWTFTVLLGLRDPPQLHACAKGCCIR